MSEINLRQCKVCNEIKPRIMIGKYNNNLNKKFSDSSGRLWSGSVCPQCQANRAKDNMRKLREKRKTSFNEES